MSRPSVARVYDYYLGGSHNFESDRAFGDQAIRAMPELRAIARDNRDFLRRVVRYLCGQGIEQFLDLGSGIPTVGNVHEVAQAALPGARVVYVDHDPVAVAHGQALLVDDDLAAAVLGDVRDPVGVLDSAVGTGLLDPAHPVGVLMFAVLPFISDDDRPAEVVAGYLDAVPRGSYLAVSHGRRDGQQRLRAAAKVYDQDRSPNPIRLRTAAELAPLLAGVVLVEPGLVPMPRWRPDPVDDRIGEAAVGEDYPILAAVGRRE